MLELLYLIVLPVIVTVAPTSGGNTNAPSKSAAETDELTVLPVMIVFVMVTVAGSCSTQPLFLHRFGLIRNFRHCCYLLCCR